jgi:UDP-4-amino-4-deoxy-L-arabinose-oxoglutarate aminotransferase
MKVPFYQHSLGTKEIQSVTQVLHSLFLTTGPKTAAFEKAFAQYLGAKHAIGVSSWTMGGLITLLALDIGPGDEVITTPLTFIATANVIVNAGAKPVFVDVEPETGNINVRLIQKAITKKTKAILPVHLYGQMCDMRAIRKIADEHGLVVIEDAAHCVEGMRDGIKPGTLSDAAIFSFYATKNLACGEGGAVVTNHTPLAEKLRLLRLHGMSQSALDRYHSHYQHWDMKILGHKCNMSDLQAALLLPQLERLEILL